MRSSQTMGKSHWPRRLRQGCKEKPGAMELLEKYRRQSCRAEHHASSPELPEVTIDGRRGADDDDDDGNRHLSRSDWAVHRTSYPGDVRSAGSSPEARSLTTSIETLSLHSLNSVLSDGNPNRLGVVRVKRSDGATRRLQRLKADMAVLSSKMRKSNSDLTRSLDNFLKGHKKGPCSACVARLQSKQRDIKVEYADGPSPRGSKNRLYDDDACVLDQPDHNFTSHLVMTGLKDGRFQAEIPLSDLPAEDLLIRIRGYELEIIVNCLRCEKCDRGRKVSVPYHIGVIDLPIFVEPKSLNFGHDAERNVILLDGDSKGCFSRRRSASFGSGVQILQNGSIHYGSQRRSSMGDKWKKLIGKLGPRRPGVSEENIVDQWKSFAASKKAAASDQR